MANLFEQYIQTELPKRPYLETDAAKESIIVRRGNGPRQLQGMTLKNGEVLGKVDGVLVGIDASTFGQVKAIAHTQESESSVWTITHNLENVNVQVATYDDQGKLFIPDTVTVSPNEIVVDMLQPRSGHATVVVVA